MPLGDYVLTLGEAIRQLRKASGLSQRKLAAKLKVDATYLSHLESDRREPSLRLLKKFAQILEVPPGVLLALVVWSQLPEDKSNSYRPLVEKLLELSKGEQYAMMLDEGL